MSQNKKNNSIFSKLNRKRKKLEEKLFPSVNMRRNNIYLYTEPVFPGELSEYKASVKGWCLFSIVVPVYNTPVGLLEKLLQSVFSQWYPNWELVLVNDASSDLNVKRTLTGIKHPQVKILDTEGNLGISGATNLGVKHAKGEFIVFLDHDDELTVDCLYELAKCIEKHQPDFIYSDEDKISEKGKYVQPHFKPDWSPDTIMSTMYTCHVSCIRKRLLVNIGMLRSEFDGSQDWDLVLRVSEHTNRIRHIDKVLYHWRIIPESSAADLTAKPYAVEASKRVRIEALKRRGLKGVVEAVKEVPGHFRINYQLLGTPLISVIIPTRDNDEVLSRCIDSILKKSTYDHYEIIIVDNGSQKPSTLEYLRKINNHPCMKVVRYDIAFNFSALCNFGVYSSSGDILLFLNDDTEVITADWLERMGGYAQLGHIGAVGAKLLYPGTENIQHSGVVNLKNGPSHAFLNHASDQQAYFMRNMLEYDWVAVTGACLMIERKKYEKIGGFDETFPVAYNDVDLCFRLLNCDLYNVVCQAVALYHHESFSRGSDHLDTEKLKRLKFELQRLYNKHSQFAHSDPFYNRNLSQIDVGFKIKNKNEMSS